jgi:plasmid stabilization system protein ParE
MADYAFHPDALLEYADATTYYLGQASVTVAERFAAAVEAAVACVVAAPDRFRVVEQPGIRRYVFRRFPYVLYYRWDAKQNFVTIFAVMHCGREPGYWKHRIAQPHG